MTKGTIIIVILLLLILIALVYIILNMNNEPDQAFRTKVKKITSLYEEILVKIEKIPNMRNRTFVNIEDIEKLVQIQSEVRKPIYYLENNNCVDFFIITKEEICVYTIKLESTIISPLEEYITEMEESKPSNSNILEDIENTTIIKTEDGLVYKVSPMRKEKKKKKDDNSEIEIKEIKLSDTKEIDIDDLLNINDEDEEEPEEEKEKVSKKEKRVKKFQEKQKKEQRKNKQS